MWGRQSWHFSLYLDSMINFYLYLWWLYLPCIFTIMICWEQGGATGISHTFADSKTPFWRFYRQGKDIPVLHFLLSILDLSIVQPTNVFLSFSNIKYQFVLLFQSNSFTYLQFMVLDTFSMDIKSSNKDYFIKYRKECTIQTWTK